MGATMQEKNNATAHSTTSNGVNSSEIQALTRAAQEREESASEWNGRYIGAAGITVFVVALTFIIQAVAHRKDRLLSDSQTRLLKLKDDQYQLDLARVRRDSAQALDNAGDANHRAGVANERASRLEVDAAQARQETELLKSQNLATESKLAAANRALEAERATRLELEKSLAPRSFEIKVAASPDSNFEELKPFGGTNVIFEVLTDAEARRAANEIGNLVGFAGWKVVSVKSNPELWPGFFDGVSIVPPEDFLSDFQGKLIRTNSPCRKEQLELRNR